MSACSPLTTFRPRSWPNRRRARGRRRSARPPPDRWPDSRRGAHGRRASTCVPPRSAWRHGSGHPTRQRLAPYARPGAPSSSARWEDAPSSVPAELALPLRRTCSSSRPRSPPHSSTRLAVGQPTGASRFAHLTPPLRRPRKRLPVRGERTRRGYGSGRLRPSIGPRGGGRAGSETTKGPISSRISTPRRISVLEPIGIEPTTS